MNRVLTLCVGILAIWLLLMTGCGVIVIADPYDPNRPHHKRPSSKPVAKPVPTPKPSSDPYLVRIKGTAGLQVPSNSKYRSSGSSPVRYFVMGHVKGPQAAGFSSGRVYYVAFKNFDRRTVQRIELELSDGRRTQKANANLNIRRNQEASTSFRVTNLSRIRTIEIKRIRFREAPNWWPGSPASGKPARPPAVKPVPRPKPRPSGQVKPKPTPPGHAKPDKDDKDKKDKDKKDKDKKDKDKKDKDKDKDEGKKDKDDEGDDKKKGFTWGTKDRLRD